MLKYGRCRSDVWHLLIMCHVEIEVRIYPFRNYSVSCLIFWNSCAILKQLSLVQLCAKVWTGLICFGMGPVVGICEHGTESSGLTDDRNYLNSWETTSFSKELCFTRQLFIQRRDHNVCPFQLPLTIPQRNLPHILAVRNTTVRLHIHCLH